MFGHSERSSLWCVSWAKLRATTQLWGVLVEILYVDVCFLIKRKKERKKKYTDWEGRNKIVFVYR